MRYIYKFKSLNHVLDIIKYDSVYLSSPFDFNDPLDSFFCTLLGGSKNEFLKTEFRIKPMKDFVDLANSLHIFCGTKRTNLKNVLMWSHYADFHKGVIIKYRVPKEKEKLINEVDYAHTTHEAFMEAIGNGNPFKIPERSFEKKQDLVFHSALKKNKEWHYEDEVRYVRFLQKNESVIEEGWKVEELYLGYKYLENSNDKLGNILKILDICREKNIKVYTMSFDFNKQKKQFKLQVNKWIKNKQSLEIENYSRIKRCVLQKLKDRILNSTEGIVLKEIIEEVAKEQFKKKSQ